MEVKDALSLFLDICLKQRTLPQSLETLGIHGDYVGKVGVLQRNLFYDAIKRYASPVSDTVHLVCSTYFEATIRDCNLKVSAREMSKRFAEFLSECLPIPRESAWAFVIPLGEAEDDLIRTKDSLIACFNEIFDSMKGCSIFEPEPVANEVIGLASRLREARGCRLDNSTNLYLNKFRKRLHLERAATSNVSLESIYVEPEYVHCMDPYKERRIDAPLKEVVEAFVRNDVSRFGKLDGEARVMTLLGQPGVGKTSFLQFLINEHALGRLCPEVESLYCIPLRDLANSEFTAAHKPLKYIKDGLGLDERGLDNALLILDGLDELCLVLSAGGSINDFYLSLIRDADNYRNCHIIVTSRLNYVSAVFSTTEPTIVFELKEFSWPKAEMMIAKIGSARGVEIPRETVDSLGWRFEDYPFLSVPLLLYTIMALDINVSDVNEIGQLYDKIFAEMTDRTYGVSGRQRFSEIADPRELARVLASDMRCRGRKYLDSYEAAKALSRADLSLPEGADREAIEKSYGLTFFYEKRHPELFAPEFLHLTFVEFLAAEQIYTTLARAIEINSTSEFAEGLILWWKEFDYLFSGADLSDQVLEFFKYKVESNHDHLPKETILSTMLEWLFSAYLDKGMVYSAGSTDIDNCVVKASRLFVGYWRLMKCLRPDESIIDTLDPNERIDFFHFLRIASRNSDVPLSFRNENLALCDLRDLDLSYCDLSGADLSQSNLSYTRLRECNLEGANLLCSCLDMADFTGAHMDGACIAYAYSESARFDDIDVMPAVFPNNDLGYSGSDYDEDMIDSSDGDIPSHMRVETPHRYSLIIDEEQEASGTFVGLAYEVMKPEDDEARSDLLAKRNDARGFWEEL